jgi:nicotinate dehydrogenase subunit A
MSQTIAFTVNGNPVTVVVADEQMPLLDVLRNELHLMGTRFGCGLEQCGCCIVLIEGKPEKSCGRAIGSVAGCDVTTVEGIGTGKATSVAASLPRGASGAVRILSERHPHLCQGVA